MDGKIGVLALQGGFAKHCQKLDQIEVPCVEVRSSEQLAQCEGLIIPGGESSTMLILNDLDLFTFGKPIFGTCAGMILMVHLGLLDITLKRNGYGRQLNSFASDLTIHLDKPQSFQALFIRAPRVQSIQSSEVKILASLCKEPVLLQQGNYLAAAFHPELTNDFVIHHYFIQICEKKQLLRH